MRIYMAAPLFSQVQRKYNRLIANELSKAIPRSEVILPQDFRVGPGGASFNDRRYLVALFKRCQKELRSADAVLALLDGADADSGVAFEVGFARALDKPVLGVRTDYRQLQIKGLNIMLAEGCNTVLCHFSFNEKLDDLIVKIVENLERLGTGKER